MLEKVNIWLSILFFSLIVFGIIIINSVSVYDSNKLKVSIEGKRIFCENSNIKNCISKKNKDFSVIQRQEIKKYGEEYCNLQENNCNNFYIIRHIKYVFMGIFIFFASLIIPIFFWHKISSILYLGSLGLLLSLFLTNFGGDWGTAKSWINVPFLPSIQPSEIAKLTLVLYLAKWMEKRKQELQYFTDGFISFSIIMLPIIILLALQPDFGSLLVISSIAVCMFFTGGGNAKHIILVSSTLLIIIFIILNIIGSNCKNSEKNERGKLCYISERISSFSSNSNEDDKGQDLDYQVLHSIYAIGSGGLLGVGVGDSAMRHGFIPEVQSDTIFASVGEELGFIRTTLFLLIFTFISIFGYEVAKKSDDRFKTLVAIGITTWFSIQSIINLFVVLKLFPVTGITLPFISYGGSSLLSLCLAFGILVKISSEFSLNSNENNNVGRRIRRSYISRYRSSR